MEELYSYHNGSKLYKTTIRKILEIPVWGGNRALDRSHVEKIRNSMNTDGKPVESLDSGFHIVRISENDSAGKPCFQKYLVDGQHRVEVIRELIQPIHDFPVTCIMKDLTSEHEIIEYFNTINNAKPIIMSVDPKMVTNVYIAAISKAFQGKNLIRTKKTVRPFLYVEDLRNELEKYVHKLNPTKVDKFVMDMLNINKKMLREIELESAISPRIRDKGIKESAILHGFALAVVQGLPWIQKILQTDLIQ